MTERKSRRRKREEDDEEDEEDTEPSDEQAEIAKFLRFNCPTKSSNYRSEKVVYFKGSKAIDCLLDSKWASGQKGAEILFTDRGSVQDYLHILLELGLFKRVTRVRKKKKSEKDDGKKTKEGQDSPKSNKSKKDSTATTEGNNEDGKKKKFKVKVKLELHDYQLFLDGDEVYMWIYDPIHPRTIIYGVLVVIAAIVLCLFPLWPMQMREYVWYLSVFAAILLGFLIVVALLRYVIFGFVWGITAGRHHFWLLPNLTEECGFLESFVPLFTHAYINGSKDKQEPEDTKEDSKEDSKDNSKEDSKDNSKEDSKDNSKDNEGNTEPSKDDSPKTSKYTKPETEPWVKVTDEDVAQAKEATGNESDHQSTTDPEVTC